jgi:subtilase family serine protease
MKRILFLLLLAMVAASAAASQNEGAPAAHKGPAGASGGIVPNPAIDENGLITLSGNTRPEANAANDRGAVPDSFGLEHMMLQLRRTPQQEQAVEQFIDQLHDPKSPNFRHWLSAQEFGRKYGLPPEKLDLITDWLSAQGFVVNVVYPNHMLIDFSGDAGLIRQAFHTELHYLEVDGERHYANMSDPKIPYTLAPMVAGIVSLHDFRAYPQSARAIRAEPNFTTTGGSYVVAPADLATIYNFNQLFKVGVTGVGQTVVVVESSDVANSADFDTFRSVFGLSSYSGASFTTIHPPPPSGTNNCSDPGANGDEGEAALDIEMVTSAAPSAAVILASCADTATTYGFFTATQNLINSATPPPIISVSYGVPETDVGSSANAAINSAYQQGVAEGVSIFVSSGDQSASGDRFATGGEPAVHGIRVNAFSSTPYNVSVGATDFGDTYAGTNSTYWSSTNASTYGSALSYIPEIPMSSSCANVLVADYAGYNGITYGTSGFCNSSEALTDNLVGTWGTSGGPSGCATGAPSVGNSTGNVVSGTCAGYAKPSWQSVLGNPKDQVRDIPDISLFGAVEVSVSDVWNHSYVICDTGTAPPSGCSGTDPNDWTFVGGTSAATPVVAGIQADLMQTSGVYWGNMDYYYYNLASTEYGTSGNSACDSNLGKTVGSSCIFYDVTPVSLLYGGSGTGSDMDVPCTTSVTTNNCFIPSGTYGVLSLSTTSYQPAYTTTTGWDFATGIGTPNAYNLVAALSPPVVSLSPASVGFEGQDIGTSSAAKKVTLSNTDLGALNLTSLSINGSNSADFLLSQSCPGTLAFGANCQLSVTFKPTGAGPRKASISISDNAGGSPQTVILTGVGTGVSLTPTSLSFPSEGVGTSSAPMTVTLKNEGSATMHIWEIAIAGTNAGDFSNTTTCGSTLGVGLSCTVSVTFTPTATGARSVSLLFSDDGGGSPQAVPVTGTGT